MTKILKFSTPDANFATTLSSIDERIFDIVGKRAHPGPGSLLQQSVWWAEEDRPKSTSSVSMLGESSVALLRKLVAGLGEKERDVLLQQSALCAEEKRPKSMSRVSLLGEVEAVLGELERDIERLSYAYTYAAQVTDANGLVIETRGMGGLHGMRLEGDAVHVFGLRSGIGLCELQKWGIDGRGLGVLLETTDCRHLKSLVTTNMGVIKFGRRRVKTSLRESLAGLRDFLRGQDAETVDLAPDP